MTALRASFRYELRMQLRKPSVWITMAALAGLTAATPQALANVLGEPDAKAAMVRAGWLIMMLMPLGFGCLVADRLVRDEQLKVRDVLDATPGAHSSRLAGKYLGACLATGVPILVAYLLLAAAYADPAAFAHAGTVTVAVIIPALLFIGAFAMLCPLLMPAPLFRVLFVGYWFWTNLVHPSLMPTLNRTVVNPLNGYVIDVFVPSSHNELAGGVPGAALNLLRPMPTTATAVLSLTVLLVLAALALAGAHAMLARTAR